MDSLAPSPAPRSAPRVSLRCGKLGHKVVNVAREDLVPPQRSEAEAVAELRAGMEKLGMPTENLEAMLRLAHAEFRTPGRTALL